MNKKKDKKYWFKPKRYGYGATPISFEGWLVVLFFIIALFYNAIYILPLSTGLFFFLEIVLILLLIHVSRIKTKEKWVWRWGKK